MKRKVTAVLFVVVFLLVAAVICTFLTSLDRGADPEPTPVPAAVVTAEPPAVETPAPTNRVITPSTPFPVPTETPAQATQPPAATPVPETAPFAVPAESTGGRGVTLGSGSFRSNTGSNIDVRADWEAVTSGAEQVEITVTVYVESYAIHLSAMPNTVNISLNGQYASLGAPSVDYDGGPLVSNRLASETFTIECGENSSRDVGLQVEWHFNGVYGGVDIPVIECGGTFTVSR